MEFVKRRFTGSLLMASAALGLSHEPAEACTRILYETGTGT